MEAQHPVTLKFHGQNTMYGVKDAIDRVSHIRLPVTLGTATADARHSITCAVLTIRAPMGAGHNHRTRRENIENTDPLIQRVRVIDGMRDLDDQRPTVGAHSEARPTGVLKRGLPDVDRVVRNRIPAEYKPRRKSMIPSRLEIPREHRHNRGLDFEHDIPIGDDVAI